MRLSFVLACLCVAAVFSAADATSLRRGSPKGKGLHKKPKGSHNKGSPITADKLSRMATSAAERHPTTVDGLTHRLDKLKNGTRWHRHQKKAKALKDRRDRVPKALKAAAKSHAADRLEAIPMVALGGCGERVSTKELGLKPRPESALKALKAARHASSLIEEAQHKESTKGAGWEVKEGNCQVDDLCVESPPLETYTDYYSNEIQSYPHDHNCVISMTGGEPRPLKVYEFNTESGFDYLVVNGQQYHGRGVEQGPEGVVPTGDITWDIDGSVGYSGFKVCYEPVEDNEAASSRAMPGVGAKQTLADNDLDVPGTVGGEEVAVRVLKDGFFEVGCFNDAMVEHADKFGNDKDQYGYLGEYTNVSVAKYKELILEDRQKAMTPRVCFEFCRTIKGMVFFGIRNGDECYCEPYFKNQAGDDAVCDVPCAGDSKRMCGSMKKSTVWEMHMCANTAEDLENSIIAGEEALTFFYESASLAVLLGKKMTEAGDALKSVGGLSGSPASGNLGLAAMKAGGTVQNSYKAGKKKYRKLKAATEEALELEGGDFTLAETANKADRAVGLVQKTEGQVLGLASDIYDTVRNVHPGTDYQAFGEEPKDPLAKDLRTNANATDYRPAPYALGSDEEPHASACSGEVIGLPRVGLGTMGCALTCEHEVYPTKCVAFSSYQVEGKEDLCFLFSDVTDVEVWEPPASAALVQRRLRQEGSDKKGAAVCKVKMSEIASGFRPKGELKKLRGCFGTCDSDFVAKVRGSSYTVPTEVTVQGKVVLQPFDTGAGESESE